MGDACPEHALMARAPRRSGWRRFGAWSLALLLAVALAAWKREAIVAKALDLRYGATLKRPARPEPADATQARLQDLDDLAALPSLDRSFSARAQAAFAQRVAALRAHAATLTPAQFLMGVANAVAQADNAHTNVELASWRAGLARAPVRFAWFAEGLFIVRARREHAGLLGMRVSAIDGFDPAALDRECARYFGGTPEYAHAAATVLLESPAALHELERNAADDRLVLEVQDAQGRGQSVELAAEPPEGARDTSKPGRVLAPAPLAVEAPGAWRTVLPAYGNLPPSLREPRQSVYATALDRNTLYLHLWQIRSDASRPIGAAIEAALGPAGAAPWQRIVLDLRFDAGGDYPTILDAMKALPRRLAPSGRLEILIDNTTFSAAIITAVLARHYTGPRTTVVGEDPGDRLVFWAEGTPLELAHSRIRIGVATGLHDWAHGCREWRCYWPNLLHDVAGGSLEPRVRVAWRFSDYRRGIDTVLEQALQ
jgi:hypothetical protein